MKNFYDEMPNGYQESIQKGLSAVRYFSRNMSFQTGSEEERIARLKQEIEAADAIVIGAGAGLSTSAMKKHVGHGGQGISISTDILMHRSLSIRNCSHL